VVDGRGPNGRVPEGSALESVRRLEATLENRRELQEVARARLAAAREEAGRMVAGAREEARRALEERRRRELAAADAESERLISAARDEANALRAVGQRHIQEAVRVVLDHILPPSGGGA
jgi:hypothetical protein